MEPYTVFGVRIDDLSADELRTNISEQLASDALYRIVTPNPEMILLSRSDDAFKQDLVNADLSLPDGVGLRYAVAALTERFLQNRHTGVDTLDVLAAQCEEQKKRLLLLGGDPKAAELSAEEIRKRYPTLYVHCIDPGDVRWDGADTFQLSQGIEAVVQALQPDAIAVALGQKKQEAFLHNYVSRFNSVKLAIGVGGALEMISEQKKRGPKWMRIIGLEFIWRLLIEPKRAGRIIRASMLFPVVVAREALKQRRFIKACSRVFPEVARQLTNRSYE